MKKSIQICLYLFLISWSIVAIKESIQKIPPGPYLKTCKNCIIVDGTLQCECHQNSEEWNNETLPNANKCKYDLVNDHGSLKCIINGPYLETCARCWMVHDTLYCIACKNRRGQTVQLLQYFSLPFVSQCQYSIVNNNAELNCLPQGQYLQHCSTCQIKDDELHCWCSMTPNQKKTLYPASIDLKTCPNGTIFYSEGLLECIE